MLTERFRHENLLSFLIGHDANACLISLEGQWGYENSERVDGIKQSSDYQVAVDRLLMRLGVKKVDINLLVLTTTQGALLPIFNEKKFNIIGWKKHKLITPQSNISRSRPKSKSFKNSSLIWIIFDHPQRTTFMLFRIPIRRSYKSINHY